MNVYGEVRKYLTPGRKPTFELRVPAGMAVNDVLDYLKVPEDLPVAVVVNGIHRSRAYRLAEADVLSVFPMTAFAELVERTQAAGAGSEPA